MGVRNTKSKTEGFAALEGLLLLVIAVAIVGVGAFVIHQKHSAEKTLSSSVTTSGQATAPTGTTANIDQLTQQDAQTETSADNTADAGFQQAATGANGAVNNVGGAYNEANY
jgi:hypothetical protein